MRGSVSATSDALALLLSVRRVNAAASVCSIAFLIGIAAFFILAKALFRGVNGWNSTILNNNVLNFELDNTHLVWFGVETRVKYFSWAN